MAHHAHALLPVVLLALLLPSGSRAYEEGTRVHMTTGYNETTAGVSTDGLTYSSIDEAWDELLGKGREQAGAWYNRALEFWESQPATSGGIFTGYGHLNDVDLRDSKKFIQDAYNKTRGSYKWLEKYGNGLSVLELGAGIGRVTAGLLLPTFGKVHVTEPSYHLLEHAMDAVSPVAAELNKEATFEMVAMQTLFWQPEVYDAVWAQWCLMYLTDYDLTAVLYHAKRSLKPGGLVFVKENLALPDVGFVVNRVEGSLVRNQKLFEQAIRSAGLKIVHEAVQTGFDEGLYEAHMWALKDAEDDSQGHVEL